MSEAPTFIDETRDNVTIIYATTERLLDPRLADTLTRHLLGLLDAGAINLLVDLSGVTRLSSVFFRSFLTAGKKARELGTTINFCNVTPLIHEGFTITGLDQLHRIFESENQALTELG